ncbi:hypothetical protein QAD02_009562 [Eretmocerus hayati]|uniref:Uncharacterized protein n=1 Tax=Eretmocerus hayati TaxID=131215 RepID=A0ACC2N9K1_9HYME|nr:hypothetical protein QAD02_009562 [Eretmocerus hayati]
MAASKDTALMVTYEIINAIQANRFLYDKGMDEYMEKWRDERPAVLKKIAKDISEQFDIKLDGTTGSISQFQIQIFVLQCITSSLLSEQSLWSKWMGIVKKYKEEHKKVKAYEPSGSGTDVKITSNWPFYKDMVWLEPFVDHLPQMSNVDSDGDSETLPESPSESQHAKKTFKKRKPSKNQDYDTEILENLLKTNQATLSSIEQQVAQAEEADPLSNYLPLINMRHNEVPDCLKYECTKQVLAYISYYVKKNCGRPSDD